MTKKLCIISNLAFVSGWSGPKDQQNKTSKKCALEMNLVQQSMVPTQNVWGSKHGRFSIYQKYLQDFQRIDKLHMNSEVIIGGL